MRASPRLENRIRRFVDFQIPATVKERRLARQIDRLIIPLGPYRNLTTLTAALFALHPECVVLNHAGIRLFGGAADPFSHLEEDQPERFVLQAMRLLRTGRRGDYGGNIRLSHAFDRAPLKHLYHNRYADVLLKSTARALFWKESMRIQNRLQAEPDKFEAILERHDSMLFLLPIRHPIDCAKSNLKTGHVRHLTAQADPSVATVVTSILESIAWFCQYERDHPQRFWSFTALEIDAGFPSRLADFCDLQAPQTWLADAQTILNLDDNYHHTPEDVAWFRSEVDRLFSGDAVTQQRLLRFVAETRRGD